MSQEKDKLLDHNYDGIQEYDNPLPKWWLGLFYISIIIAIVYVPYYHMFGGKLPRELYEEEMASAAAMKKVQEQAAPAKVEAAGPADAVAGKGIYTANCVACHGANGEGGIGPNLTDKFWIHGNTTANLVKTVTDGVPEKGMVAWKAILGPKKINDVVAYIETLKGTNPPNGKAPQGTEYP
ncbi:MAG: c-type cytochrome [SAR324 cluster bacterium]|nr:c-type cytochrome [SAR324 cluster bacterium]